MNLHNRVSTGVLVAVVLVVMVWLGLQNFPAFHLVLELVGVSISIAIFSMGWNTRHLTAHDFFAVMGCGYLGSAFLELLHIVTHPGMPSWTWTNPNLSVECLLASRTIVLAAFHYAIYVRKRQLRVKHEALLGFFIILVGLGALLAVLHGTSIGEILVPTWRLPWQMIWRAVLVGAMVFGFWELNKIKDFRANGLSFYVNLIILSRSAAELAFTLRTDPSGHAALIAHFLKLVSQFGVYRVLVVMTMQNPYNTLFQDLTDAVLFLRAQRHDMLNDLTLASTYLQLNRPREAQQCLEVLAADLSDRYNYTTLPKDAWFQIINAKSRIAREKGIKFRYRLEAPMPNDFNQRRLLPKVVANLLDNAIDAAALGEDPWISLEWTAEAGDNVLRVTNSGPPIPDEIQAQLFEPGLSTKGDDRGFGLTICRKIANELGGRLVIENSFDSTSFVLILPNVRAENMREAAYL